ncbi:hypothetical protein [Streptomyces cuspidosporus]|uniref:GST C-terminal domain-containing protein n=1 Tax=Streptomyces cuspidosporus TaxID=66882 RepID=A0ABN3FYU4_9ACTN
MAIIQQYIARHVNRRSHAGRLRRHSDPSSRVRPHPSGTLLGALDLLDGRLAGGPYALGDELTAPDVYRGHHAPAAR